MAFGDTIRASLGLDTAGFQAGLAQSESRVSRFGSTIKGLFSGGNQAVDEYGNRLGRLSSSTDLASKSQERLLVGSHRVARQIGNTTSEILSGADAAQVFATSVEGLGRSLHLGLGTIAGLAVGGIAVDKIHQIVVEYEGLNKEIDKLVKKRDSSVDVTPLVVIEDHLNKTTAALAKLREQDQGKGIGHFFADLFKGLSGHKGEGTSIDEVRRRRTGQIKSLSESESEDLGGIATKKEHEIDLKYSGKSDFQKRASQLKQDFGEKIAETSTPGSPKENQRLGVQLRRELELALNGLARDVAVKRHERTQFSLQELADRPEGLSNEQSIQSWWAGHQARDVQSLDARGKAQAVEDPKGALATLDRADKLRNSITELKASEKTDVGVGKELDSTQMAKDIAVIKQEFQREE